MRVPRLAREAVDERVLYTARKKRTPSNPVASFAIIHQFSETV